MLNAKNVHMNIRQMEDSSLYFDIFIVAVVVAIGRRYKADSYVINN